VTCPREVLRKVRIRESRLTGSFINDYKPIRCYIYPDRRLPPRSLGFFARALLSPRRQEFSGRYLFEVVNQPAKAHFLVLSADVNWFENRETEIFDHLPLLNGNEHRHLFVDTRDNSLPIDIPGSISFKVSVDSSTPKSNVICIPYIDTVDDFSYYFHCCERQLDYGASFVGGDHPHRRGLLAALADHANFPMFLSTRPGCYVSGHLNATANPYSDAEKDERRRARREFISATLKSRYMLALPGYGANTSRFFEGLALGVGVVMISRPGVVLPFEDVIPYQDFAYRVATSGTDPETTVKDAINWIESNWYDAAAMGRLARIYYEAHLGRANLLYGLYRQLAEFVFS
jgi:hypothetical protein